MLIYIRVPNHYFSRLQLLSPNIKDIDDGTKQDSSDAAEKNPEIAQPEAQDANA